VDGVFRHGLSVPAAPEQTWPVLADVARVAAFLPGAVVEPSVQDGVVYGELRVNVGAVSLHYRGTLRRVDLDDDARAATFEARGAEAEGPGTAAALIRAELVPNGTGTEARVEVRLQATGRLAGVDRGAIDDAAGGLLTRFAERFERAATDVERLHDPSPAAPARRRIAPLAGVALIAAAAVAVRRARARR
jgi:carbon monoxide dehydrogenase subunit G